MVIDFSLPHPGFVDAKLANEYESTLNEWHT